MSLSLALTAQEGWELGGNIGVGHYFGDLNTDFSLNDPGISIGAVARYNFNNRVSISLSANYVRLSGDDADSENSFERTRNLNFRSNTFDGTARIEFNFLPYTHGSKDEYYTPYLFGGLSVVYFNPEGFLNDEWHELRPLGTEGQFLGEEYYSVAAAVTYGIGLKFDLSYEWSLNFELSGRYLFTDYFDDVSTTYPDFDDLESLRGAQGPLAVALSDPSIPIDGEQKIGQPGRQRGNAGDNDMYAIFRVGIMYYFGDIKCPPYSR